MNRAAAEARGRRAERRAAWWLRLHGWRILGMAEAIDVIVPRGGKSLIERVQNESRVPVFAHLEGLCHVYVDAAADLDMAIDEFRLRRVAAAAEMLSARFARPDDDIRIDVMLLAPGRLPRHLVHVWQP